MTVEIDDSAWELEQKIMENNERESRQQERQLIQYLKTGKISNLAKAQRCFKKKLSTEQIQQIYMKHTADGRNEARERLTIYIPIMLKAYLSCPVMHTSIDDLLEEAISRGALDMFSKNELSSILNCSISKIDEIYNRLNPPQIIINTVPEESTMANKPLFEQLMLDAQYQAQNFRTKKAQIQAILSSPKYWHLRNVDIARFCNISAGNMSVLRSEMSTLVHAKKEATKEETTEKETTEEMVNDTGADTIKEKPTAAQESIIVPQTPIEAPTPQTEKIVNVQSIVCKQKIDELLICLYPDGVKPHQFITMRQVLKHLKKAIKARG